MYLKTKLSWNVVIPSDKMDVEGLMLKKAIIIRLMEDFAAKRATKDLGYFLAVSIVLSIGEGKVRQHSGDVLLPVDFTCLTFKILPGEVLLGTVHKILNHGVFLRTGPCDKLYLSNKKMADYQYVPGETPYFMNEKSAKIEKGVVVCFFVVGLKFMESDNDFRAVVSLEGYDLGPVS